MQPQKRKAVERMSAKLRLEEWIFPIFKLPHFVPAPPNNKPHTNARENSSVVRLCVVSVSAVVLERSVGVSLWPFRGVLPVIVRAVPVFSKVANKELRGASSCLGACALAMAAATLPSPFITATAALPTAAAHGGDFCDAVSAWKVSGLTVAPLSPTAGAASDKPPTPAVVWRTRAPLSIVLPGVAVGSIDAIRSVSALKAAGITHVVSVLSADKRLSVEPLHRAGIAHTRIAADDATTTPLLSHFDDVCTLIDAARADRGGVLVHCQAGISRSVTLVLAYLVRRLGWTPTEALEHARAVRPQAAPNVGFMQQLDVWAAAVRKEPKACDDVARDLEAAAALRAAGHGGDE